MLWCGGVAARTGGVCHKRVTRSVIVTSAAHPAATTERETMQAPTPSSSEPTPGLGSNYSARSIFQSLLTAMAVMHLAAKEGDDLLETGAAVVAQSDDGYRYEISVAYSDVADTPASE